MLLGGRARGLAAGTLLACGSVLAVTVHAADSSGPHHARPSGLVTSAPGAVSGGYTAAPAAASAAAPPAVTSAQSAQPLGGPQVRAGAVARNVPRDIDVPRPRPAQPVHRDAAPTMSPTGRPDQAQGAVEGMVPPAAASVAQPISRMPATVVDAVGEVVVPGARSSSSAGSSADPVAGSLPGSVVGSVLDQVPAATRVPVAQVLTPLESLAQPVHEATQPAMSMLAPLPLG